MGRGKGEGFGGVTVASRLCVLNIFYRFNPDRFAAHTSHAKRGLEFCPFGTPSRRKCPGYVFSHFETTVILSILLQRFRIVPVPDQVVELDHGLVTGPKSELYITVKER